MPNTWGRGTRSRGRGRRPTRAAGRWRVVPFDSSFLLDERAHDEPDDGLLRGALVHDLRMWVPVPVHGPEHDRLDQQAGGDGRGRNGAQRLPARPVLDVLREHADQAVAGALEPQRGELGVIASRAVEEFDPVPVPGHRVVELTHDRVELRTDVAHALARERAAQRVW